MMRIALQMILQKKLLKNLTLSQKYNKFILMKMKVKTCFRFKISNYNKKKNLF